MAKSIKAKSAAAAIVPMKDTTAQLAPLTNTAKDDAIRCPFTRRDAFRNMQADVRQAGLWLASLAGASVVVKAGKMYVNEVSEYNAQADDVIVKTWTITRYAETAHDDADGIRLDVNLLRRACATGERLGYRFVNVSLKTGGVDFTK